MKKFLRSVLCVALSFSISQSIQGSCKFFKDHRGSLLFGGVAVGLLVWKLSDDPVIRKAVSDSFVGVRSALAPRAMTGYQYYMTKTLAALGQDHPDAVVILQDEFAQRKLRSLAYHPRELIVGFANGNILKVQIDDHNKGEVTNTEPTLHARVRGAPPKIAISRILYVTTGEAVTV